MKKKNKNIKLENKNNKELLFMFPVDKSMTVNEVYLKLIENIKKKGFKIKGDNWFIILGFVITSKSKKLS